MSSNTSTSGAMTTEGFASTRATLERARHLPGRIYSSPDIYQSEVEEFFMKDWLYVGRVEEVEKPGDYMAMRLVDQPVVVSRDRNGELHAYFNMCVHRGVEVAQGSGNTRAFKCPYHGWVYDLAGKLTGAAFMKETEEFDPKQCRMKPIRLDTWRGNIFVTFNPDAPSLDRFIAEFEHDFGFLHMENCRLGNKIVLDVACNWKFIPENLMDFYHVGVLHAKSFGSKFSWDNDNVILKDGGGMTIWYDAAPPTPGGEPLLGKMPWLDDRPFSFACTGFNWPNMTLFGRIDCARIMVTWPLNVGRSLVTIYHLFPESTLERPDIEEKLRIYHDYQITVLEEDRSMIESMQKAMASPNYVPGRMSTREKPLHHFMNGYLERMFGLSARQEAAE